MMIKQKLFPIVLIFLANLGPSVSSATFENCPNLNFASRFGPPKDQGMHQYCWAMGATSLLEEERCIKDPSQCHRALSVIDASRCYLRFGHKVETGLPRWALLCGLNQGVCEEGDAPFKELQSKYYFFSKIFGARFKRTPFVQSFLSYLSTRHQGNQALLQEAAERYFEYSPTSTWNIEEVKAMMENSKDLSDFLDRSVLGKKCPLNRKGFSPHGVFTRINVHKNPALVPYYTKDELNNFSTNQSFDQLIIERLKRGRSIAIGVCLDELFGKYKVMSSKNCEFGHVIVVNGIKKNEKTQRCELHTLNSYGETNELNGWIDAEKLSAATYLLDQID